MFTFFYNGFVCFFSDGRSHARNTVHGRTRHGVGLLQAVCGFSQRRSHPIISHHQMGRLARRDVSFFTISLFIRSFPAINFCFASLCVRPSHCYLVLDILNTTPHEMEVLYTNIKRILIEARETCRVPVPIERCPLSKLASADDESAQSPEDVCREYISNLVDLKWSLISFDCSLIQFPAFFSTLHCLLQIILNEYYPAVEAHGVASISNIPWTPKMLDSICMSPVHWGKVILFIFSIISFAYSLSRGPQN